MIRPAIEPRRSRRLDQNPIGHDPRRSEPIRAEANRDIRVDATRVTRTKRNETTEHMAEAMREGRGMRPAQFGGLGRDRTYGLGDVNAALSR